MKGRTHPSPFAALTFQNLKQVPIHCWVDREFSSRRMAKPSLELTTLRRLSAPYSSCSNHSTKAPLYFHIVLKRVNMPIKFSMKNKTYSKPVAGQYTYSLLHSCFSITYKMQLSILWDSDAIVTAIIFQYFCSSLLEATPDVPILGRTGALCWIHVPSRNFYYL